MELAEHKVKLDRLSSLPDDILTQILSRLPINSAVSTSVLSHRWHHLWTGITRLVFDSYTLFKLSYILHHLSSPKLDIVKIKVSRRIPLYWHEYGDEFESCIQDICRRKVQQFILDDVNGNDTFFPMPDCLLNCSSLVNLDIYGPFYSMDYKYKVGKIQLPNLKKLSLRNLTRLPNWLVYLYKSSPLLEHLTLTSGPPLLQSMASLNLFFPNLKLLELELFPMKVRPSMHPIISINAPKLENLVTYGCVVPYKFRTNPTALVKAEIDLLRDGQENNNNDEVELHELSKFFKGVSSVSNLEVVVARSQMNIFAYMNKNPPVFFNNLVRLEVTLYDFGVKGINDLFVSMQCFPNLEHLSVILVNKYNYLISDEGNWSAPDIVPSCILSKLKTIEIEGIRGNDDGWLEILRYVLGNAKVLQNLDVLVDTFSEQVERKFCRSLFKFPRSLTCEVMFSGWFIKLSSNAFKIRNQIVKWPWLIDIIFFCSQFWFFQI